MEVSEEKVPKDTESPVLTLDESEEKTTEEIDKVKEIESIPSPKKEVGVSIEILDKIVENSEEQAIVEDQVDKIEDVVTIDDEKLVEEANDSTKSVNNPDEDATDSKTEKEITDQSDLKQGLLELSEANEPENVTPEVVNVDESDESREPNDPDNQENSEKTKGSILASIASDWCFSDGETEKEDVDEIPTETKDTKIVEVRAVSPRLPSPDVLNKSSAEIIAMDWDDCSQTDTDKKSKSVEENPEEKDKDEEVKDKKKEQLICTVSDKDGTLVEENVLILHDLNLSELNIPPQQNNSITIISVDENPGIIPPEEHAESIVIHEIEVVNSEESRVPSKSPLDKIKKMQEKPRSSYPYIICSKEEISNEISTLTTNKNQETLDQTRGDLLLKNTILKRLASKILPKNYQEEGDGETPQKNWKKDGKGVPDQELLEILEGDTDYDVYNLEKTDTSIKSDDSLQIPKPTSKRGKIMDPLTEREIALRQLSEIPETSESIYRKNRKGKSNVVVNVPSTCIIEKTEKTEGVDPFKFIENVKTEGTPSKYGPGISTVKTYNRKSIDKVEPDIKEIMQTIPKEILDLEKEHKNRKTVKKSPVKPKTETPKKEIAKTAPNQNDGVKKKVEVPKTESVKKKAPVKEEKKKTPQPTPSPEKVFLTEDLSNILVSKRSRIIKKKIIWDPSLEFPTYISPPPKVSKVQKPKDKTIPKKKLKAIGNAVKSEGSVDKKDTSSNMSTTSVEDDEEDYSDDDISEISESTGKRKSGPQSQKKKKVKLTEIDKLLMDEGAVNMLYSVEQDEKVPLIRQKQKVISMDKFDKEMDKKKKMIMSALNTTPEITPKTLRKKDSPSAMQQRKKSRESVQDPLQSPPPSPSPMFPPRAEASRIIRRHSSSSSFSSECMSPRRLSVVDQSNESTKSTKTEKSNGDANAFWSGVSNNLEENDKLSKNVSAKKRVSDSGEVRQLRKRTEVPPTKKSKTETGNSVNTTELISRKEQVDKPILEKYPSNDNYKEITLRRSDNLVQLLLTPQGSKIKNALNVQTMKEICDALTTLRQDSTCKVVLISSTGSVFCRGLDYTPLLQPNLEKRKAIATEMANAVSDLIRAIVQFPKPLVAGVQGTASGLGVSILPLCDVVLVSEKSTFSMNHCKLGCLPEGAASVSLPHVTSRTLSAKLMYMGQTIEDGWEALSHNLANEVLKDKGFNDELISVCKEIASKSSQSMESFKAIHQQSLRTIVEAALESESHLLVQHWTSAECQQLFKKVLAQNSW